MNVVRMAGVTKRYRDVGAREGGSRARGAGGVGWLALRRAVA